MDLGTAACPPYHLALVIGGTSAEANLAAVKKASAKYYDNLPTEGNMAGQAFRDLEWKKECKKFVRNLQSSAIGGKYLTHDVRVIRLPRHAAGFVQLEWVFLFCRQKYQRKNHPRRNFLRTIRNQSSAIFTRNSSTFRTSCGNRF